MSNDGPDVSPRAVSDQLRHYGLWLEERSDVPLSPIALDVSPDPSGGSGPPRRPRMAVAAAAIALVALAAVGIGVAAGNGGSGADKVATGPAEAGLGEGDTPTSDNDGRELTPEPRFAAEQTSTTAAASAEDPTAVDAETGIDDGGSDGAAAALADDGARAEEADDGASEGSGDQVQIDPVGDEVITPSTHVLPDEPTTSWVAAEGSALFVSPRSGAVLDLNQSNTIEVAAVPGATTYSIEGWQQGELVFDLSGPNRTFILPSRLIVGGGAMTMEPGQATFRLRASDSSGSVVAAGEIDVMVGSASPGGPYPQTTGG